MLGGPDDAKKLMLMTYLFLLDHGIKWNLYSRVADLVGGLDSLSGLDRPDGLDRLAWGEYTVNQH